MIHYELDEIIFSLKGEQIYPPLSGEKVPVRSLVTAERQSLHDKELLDRHTRHLEEHELVLFELSQLIKRYEGFSRIEIGGRMAEVKEQFYVGRSYLPSEEIYIDSISSLMPDAEEHARLILERFPPDQYFVVGLGLSTVLQNEMIRQIMESEGYPHSRNYLKEVPIQLNHGRFVDDDHARRTFDQIFPSIEELGGRTLVFARNLMEGGQASTNMSRLIQHAQERGYQRLTLYYTAGDYGVLSHVATKFTEATAKAPDVEAKLFTQIDPRYIKRVVYRRDDGWGPSRTRTFHYFGPLQAFSVWKFDTETKFSPKPNDEYPRLQEAVRSYLESKNESN